MIANRIMIGGEDVDLVGGTQVELTRGAEPSYATFYTGTPDRFRALSNPVTITIITPKTEDLNQEAKLELKGWHIIAIDPQDTGLYKIVLADNRFIAKYPKQNKSYNVKTIDGVYRISSLNGGNSYTIKEALDKIWKEHGLNFRVDPRCQKLVSSTDYLPTNLGNADGGGYFAETIDAVVPPITERIRASTVLDRNGNVMLTDRVTDMTAGLLNHAYEGLIDKRDIHWQIPDEIHVLFQQRYEQYFELDINSSATAPPTLDYEYDIENVVPVPRDPSLLGGAAYFIPFDPDYLNTLGFSLTEWRQRYFKPTMIARSSSLTLQQIIAKERQAQLGKATWHLLFRVKFRGTRNRIWTNLVLGRLGYDGVSTRGSYVFMDYTVLHQFPYFSQQGQRIKAVQTTQFPFPALNTLEIVESPFEAEFVTDGRNDLVFQIKPNDLTAKFAEIAPCLLERDAEWTDPMGFAADQEQDKVYDKLVAREKFKVRVYWHADLCDDNGPMGTERYYRIVRGAKKTGSTKGSGLKLVVRSDSVKANWSMQSNNTPLLLNGVTLTQEADAIVKRLEQAYADSKIGFLACVGVECLLSDANWVGGNINRVVIRIGMDADAPHTVTTLFEVLPEVSELLGDVRTDSGQSAKAGIPPALVG